MAAALSHDSCECAAGDTGGITSTCATWWNPVHSHLRGRYVLPNVAGVTQLLGPACRIHSVATPIHFGFGQCSISWGYFGGIDDERNLPCSEHKPTCSMFGWRRGQLTGQYKFDVDWNGRQWPYWLQSAKDSKGFSGLRVFASVSPLVQTMLPRYVKLFATTRGVLPTVMHPIGLTRPTGMDFSALIHNLNFAMSRSAKQSWSVQGMPAPT